MKAKKSKKSKALKHGKSIERQKPLLTVKLESPEISTHTWSGGGSGMPNE
jgi:hypothetical protein